jgi:cytochrome c oxidase subunit 2
MMRQPSRCVWPRDFHFSRSGPLAGRSVIVQKRWWQILFVYLGMGVGALSAYAQDVVTHDSWWLPPSASKEASEIDFMFNIIFVLTTVIMLAVFALLIYFLVKYRHDPRRRAEFIHGHHRAEVIWTATPAIILIIMGILSIRVWGQMRLDRPDPTKIPITEVEVLAQQFQWNIRYPGADGVMGTRDDIGTFNPDDQQKTPIVSQIHVPVNRTVRIHLRSKDVLHSFFLPNMRTKLDAVPGLHGELWFTPDQIGKFEIACAELCGPQHYTMRGVLEVMSQEDYDTWLKAEEDKVREAIGEEGGAAAETKPEGEQATAPAAEEKPAQSQPAAEK